MSDAHVVVFDDPDHHHSVQRLLPWYANGSLDDAERARVADHLAHCAVCRMDLDAQQQLRLQLDLPQRVPSADAALARLRGRLEAPAGNPQVRGWWVQARALLLGGPTWMRWTLAVQFATIALLAVLVGRAAAPDAIYLTRGAAAPMALGSERILVGFAADTTLDQLRRALRSVHGRIADGPTDTGVCVVEIPVGSTAVALAELRRQTGVRLAESLGPEAAR